MSTRHSGRVTYTHLQAVKLGYLYHCLGGPRHRIYRGLIQRRNSPYSHTDIRVNRYCRLLNAGFDKGSRSSNIPGTGFLGISIDGRAEYRTGRDG